MTSGPTGPFTLPQGSSTTLWSVLGGSGLSTLGLILLYARAARSYFGA